MPGVGPRSAERIALWMVQARGDQPDRIAQAIAATRTAIRPCPQCGFFTMEELCEICADPTRTAELLCVVEQPTDILPLEKTSAFRGRYHSLGGRISPLDHVGPEDLRIDQLIARVEREGFSEVILALAADVEGEATTNYLVELLKPFPVNLTRIAHLACRPGGGTRISRSAHALSGAFRSDETLVAKDGQTGPRSGLFPIPKKQHRVCDESRVSRHQA